MKKILILGGTARQCKLVEAAKEQGLYTIVSDYLEDSPAKKIADESWMISTLDTDAMTKACIENQVDGVLNAYIDVCQRPYYTICHNLGLPCCIKSREQAFTFTDKNAFKNACIQNGVDIIETYDEDKIEEIKYPAIVKPGYCRGSAGQSVCYTKEELQKAIAKAKKSAPDSRTVIEKYYSERNDFAVTYFAVNGEYYCVRTSDRHLGTPEFGLSGVSIGTVSPGRYSDFFFEKTDHRIRRLLKNTGIMNGPVFMQGLVDGDTIRFYDPGLRFPESDYDKMTKETTGVNLLGMLANFAVTGIMDNPYGNIENILNRENQRKYIVLYPVIRPGRISKITGVDDVLAMDCVHSLIVMKSVGEEIGTYGNTKQRFCEVDISASDISELRSNIEKVYEALHVLDENNGEMIINRLAAEYL